MPYARVILKGDDHRRSMAKRQHVMVPLISGPLLLLGQGAGGGGGGTAFMAYVVCAVGVALHSCKFAGSAALGLVEALRLASCSLCMCRACVRVYCTHVMHGIGIGLMRQSAVCLFPVISP